MSLLSKRITSNLQKVVGLKLIDVALFCFEYEIESSKMEVPFYFGGEVVLNFENETIIVTWDENAGWRDHFSLYVGGELLYLPTSTLVKWNVSKLNPWCNCISHNLISTQVYGQKETPHMVKFDFNTTKVFIGDSSQMRLGDGDDVLITTELPKNFYSEWNMMWEAFSIL